MVNMAAPSNAENRTSDCTNLETATVLSSRCSDVHICICLLCGLPGSGKTSLLRTLLYPSKDTSEEMQQRLAQFMIVGIEYDAIVPWRTVDSRYALDKEDKGNGKWKHDRGQVVTATEVLLQHICHNGLSEISLQTKPEGLLVDVWQQFLQVLELFNAERQNIRNQIVLIVDDNMYFRSMRYEYYKLARKYGTGFCQIYLQCSCEKAAERNKNRQGINQVSDEVILKMSEKLEPPDQEKHYWESNSITIRAEDSIDIDRILTMIQSAILNPVHCLEKADTEEIKKSRIECSTSLLHQADLILRKCVATKMAEFKSCMKPEQLKERSQHVLKAKEQILCKLKEGRIPILLSEELDITNASQNPDNELFTFIENVFLEELSQS
ncbi:unnamed protein product [Candidula unifasciata]|uniref:L-seryl-tRNA(Sec) kinase n=1 Tax=Candidula unifasciata TaxID=100452 RepID=A0A8S3ZUV1_9EUPU|nr:unnamed protein product [Candidula unifasciata]